MFIQYLTIILYLPIIFCMDDEYKSRLKGLNSFLLYWIEAVEIVTGEESALANGTQQTSSDENNPPMLQTLAISVTSVANQLEAEWRWYSSAIYNLNTKIIINTEWILINDSKN